MEKFNLLVLLLLEIKELNLEMSNRLSQGAYSVEKPLSETLEKLWKEYYFIREITIE